MSEQKYPLTEQHYLGWIAEKIQELNRKLIELDNLIDLTGIKIDQTTVGTTNAVVPKTYNSVLGTYDNFRADGQTRALQTIDYAHHEIHAGSHYYRTFSATVASGAVQYYLLDIASAGLKYPHMSFEFNGTAITKFEIFEDSTKSGDGDKILPLNNDRNSTNTSIIELYDAIGEEGDEGTLIWEHSAGTATQQSRSAASSEQATELVLKNNTKYLIKITSGTDGNLVNVTLEWYEHTNLG